MKKNHKFVKRARYKYSFLLLLCCSLHFQSFAQYSGDDFGLIMSRVSDKFESSFSTNAAVLRVPTYISLYNNATGAFTDVNYAATDRTNWPPMVHLERLTDLAFLYTMPGNSYYQEANIFAMISNGLAYWHQVNPNCNNWWYNQIAEPQSLGVILIQMKKGASQIPTASETNIIARMASDGGNPGAQTGANQTDVALHWLYRACLTKNQALLNTTMGYAYASVKYNSPTSEGLQRDWTFFSHGRQFYNFGYADEFIKGVSRFALYTQGTSYEISAEKLSIFDSFMRNGYLNLIRGQYIPFNSLGRGMSRPNVTKKTGSSTFCTDMITLCPEQTTEYSNAKKRITGQEAPNYNISPTNQTFFIGDYVFHQRPLYSVGIRTVSTRTMRNEYGNGENMKTYFISDGSTSIQRNGCEYFNIFPVWDWAKIPGTTAPHLTTIPKASSDWQTPGTSTFCGGASDSVYSVNSYVYYDSYSGINTGANKAWFFFDDEMVCLGAKVKSNSSSTVNTTVNQSLKRGDIIAGSGTSTSTLGSGYSTYNNNLDWVLHDETGYFFPDGGNISVGFDNRTASWYDINNSYSDNVTEDVFTLWINHGIKPAADRYAYIVVPGKTSPSEMQAYASASNIEILANTDSIQAVRHNGSNIIQAVFTKAATLSVAGTTINTSAGCAMILRGVGSSEIKMHIADPAQKCEMMQVQVLSPAISATKKNIICDFATSGSTYAGQTRVYLINSESNDYTEPLPTIDNEPTEILSSGSLADSYVYDGAKTTNYGSNQLFIVKKDNAGYQRYGYIKFSLSDIDNIAQTDTAGKITVKLYPVSVNTGYANVNWALYPVSNTSWDENTITWNNKPAEGSTAIATKKGTFTDSSEFEETNVLEFDITEYALAQYAAGKNIITVFVSSTVREPSGKGDAFFGTKENSVDYKRPALCVYAYDNLPQLSNTVSAAVLEDAYVQSSNEANNNFGTANKIIVKNTNNAVGDRKGFLKFNIQNLVDKTKETIGKVYVKLYAFTGNVDADKVNWTISSVANQTWSESNITYNNRPANGSEIATIQGFIPTDDGGGEPIASNYVLFDVTDYVIEQINFGSSTVSFMLYQSSNGAKYDMQYCSKEHAAEAKRPTMLTEIVTLSNKVTFTGNDGVILSEEETQRIPKGGDYTFTVTRKTGYDGYALKVKANDVELTPVSISGNVYTYTLENILSDQNITVELEQNTSVDFIESSLGIRVFPLYVAKNESITIENNSNSKQLTITMMNMAGQLLSTHTSKSESTTVQMPNTAGLFLIRIKDENEISKTVKVSVE